MDILVQMILVKRIYRKELLFMVFMCGCISLSAQFGTFLWLFNPDRYGANIHPGWFYFGVVLVQVLGLTSLAGLLFFSAVYQVSGKARA